MSKTAWIIFTAIIVLILGGLVLYSRSNSIEIDVSSIDAQIVQSASEQSGNIADRVFNNTQSDVVLIEYGDFECPGCAAAHVGVKTLLAEYGDRISFVFRQFPLTSIHPNARAAAAAAEAAGQQGKYWEMHDLIYNNQSVWSAADASSRTETFTSYAEQIGLNTDTFKADIASSAVNQKVLFDQALGGKQAVGSTPTFILNGEKLEEAVTSGFSNGDLTEIKKLLDAKL
jgi:protein-disulfide isomerase